MERGSAAMVARAVTSPRTESALDLEGECRRRLSLRPDDVNELRSLAAILGQRGAYSESLSLLNRALRFSPDDADMQSDMGITLERAGQLSAAADWYRRAIRLQPTASHIWSQLANCLLPSRDYEAAAGACRQAIALDPANVRAHVNLAAALMNTDRIDEAIDSYRSAIALCPDDVQAHANYGLALLLCGDFTGGWDEYEWRHKLPDRKLISSAPVWDGSDLAGRRILVVGEGGLGNVIQFLRYIPMLHAAGATVFLICNETLSPLLVNISAIEEIVSPAEPLPDHDCYCSIASLPALFGTSVETVPASVPYLALKPATIDRWRPAIEQISGLRVGVCWKGSEPIGIRNSRSFDPTDLLPLADTAGIHFINLQFGQTSTPPFVQTLAGLEPESMRLDDVGAVIQQLHLVITGDTCIAHLAGALGVPVWVALRHTADWRWMRSRSDSPWYPTMRLFREEAVGCPKEIFERIRDSLVAEQGALGAGVCA